MEAKSIICRNCGETVTLNASYETRFCPYCGRELAEPAQMDNGNSQMTSGRNAGASGGRADDGTAAPVSEGMGHRTRRATSEPEKPMEASGKRASEKKPVESGQSSRPVESSNFEQKASAGWQNTSTPAKQSGRRTVPAPMWYLGVCLLAVCWFLLVYFIVDVPLQISTGIGAALAVLGSAPLWFSRFYPGNAGKKANAFIWMVIMIVLWAVLWYAAAELI